MVLMASATSTDECFCELKAVFSPSSRITETTICVKVNGMANGLKGKQRPPLVTFIIINVLALGKGCLLPYCCA